MRPFVHQTGCDVNAKYAASSDEMVALMRSGGGGRYDMVSATGDASLRLIQAGDAAPVDVGRVPGWGQFFRAFRSPPSNTVNGKHYGIGPVGPEHADLEHGEAEAGSERRGPLQPEVQGEDHAAEQSAPDRGRGALPLHDPAFAGNRGPLRADEGAVRRDDCATEEAAAAREEVLELRLG